MRTHNGLLKWQHYDCHTKKIEKCGLKKYVIVSKYKLKNKALSNEEFISEVHWNFPDIFIYL
jgi:hypothetical protein